MIYLLSTYFQDIYYIIDTVNPTRIYIDISPRDWKFKIWLNMFDNILLNKIIENI